MDVSGHSPSSPRLSFASVSASATTSANNNNNTSSSTPTSKQLSRSLLPVPIFHDDDQLSHSFKQANEPGFRQRQRPPKLYPKHHLHHHHHHHHLHQHHSLNNNNSAAAESVFNKSMSHSSVATSVSFVGASPSSRSQHSPQSGGGAPVSTVGFGVITQRPVYSPHYRPDQKGTYFEQCFQVVARLGEGSFSEVFRARCRDDGREYAVKRSKQPYKSERYREERLDEVRRYEQLANTEHCLRLHFAWEECDHLYMQLELCRESVDAMVERRQRAGCPPLLESQVWPILADMLLGLRALHERDLLHLDVKLENVMMDDRGVCKLGDFGLVVDLNKRDLHQSCEGDSRYIAPELMQGGFSKAADVFSFGISALELCCNLALPNNGPLWTQLRNGELPQCLRQCSTPMQRLVERTMSPRGADRPTVQELLAEPLVQRVLERRRRMRPVRAVLEAPRRMVRVLRRVGFVVRRRLVWLAFRVWTVLSIRRRRSRRPPLATTPSATGHIASHTPSHRGAVFGLAGAIGGAGLAFNVSRTPQPAAAETWPRFTLLPVTPSPKTAQPPSGVCRSSPFLRAASAGGSAVTSTPTPSSRHWLRLVDSSDEEETAAAALSTPQPADRAQLLTLDDSEIEGTPLRRAAAGQAAAGSGGRGGGVAGSGGLSNQICNSTPLTTHVMGSFWKLRRTGSPNGLNDSSTHSHSTFLDGSSPMRDDRSGLSKCSLNTTKRKKLFCNADDSD